MGSTIEFYYTPEFLKSAKVLSKRYRSFPDDLKRLRDDIVKNPEQGIDLGYGVRKLRMAVKSKGKGKSGGARVISLTAVIDRNKAKIIFLYAYDKSDMASVSDAKIRQIIVDNHFDLLIAKFTKEIF